MEITTQQTNAINEMAIRQESVRAKKAEPIEVSEQRKFVDTKAAEALSIENVERAIETANTALKAASNALHFRMDKSSPIAIVSVVDENSGEVIRQLPSEETLRFARSVESMKGVIFDNAV